MEMKRKSRDKKERTEPAYGFCRQLELLLNEPVEARKWFTRATELDPQSPFAHIGAGIQSVRLKQMDKATEHLMQTVTLKPDVVEAYLLLAGIHDQAGRKEESKKYMDLATLFRPGPRP